MILIIIFFLIPLILSIPSNEIKEQKYDMAKIEKKHKDIYLSNVNEFKIPRKREQQIEHITQFFELNKKKRESKLRESVATSKKLRDIKRYKNKNKDRFLSRMLDKDPRLLELTEYNETTFY